MSEEAEAPKSKFDEMQDLLDTIKVDGPKGLEGNKQAARRARNALNDLKKICTPMRVEIQEAVKKSRED
jgi:hypothetical protein